MEGEKSNIAAYTLVHATAYESPYPKVIFGHSHISACVYNGAHTHTRVPIISHRYMCIHVHVTPNFFEFDATPAWTAIYLPGLFRTCHLPRIEGDRKVGQKSRMYRACSNWIMNYLCGFHACHDVLAFLFFLARVDLNFFFFFFERGIKNGNATSLNDASKCFAFTKRKVQKSI